MNAIIGAIIIYYGFISKNWLLAIIGIKIMIGGLNDDR